MGGGKGVVMDQVVCIRDEWPCRLLGHDHPVKDSIYTIVSVTRNARGIWYTLAEIRNYHRWDADNFRPVKKTYIGIFTSLVKTKKRERESI